METKSRATLLLVDDEADSMAILHETLMLIEGVSFDYLFASSALEAEDMLRGKPVDVVIADILMPGMSGFDLLRKCHDEGFYLPFLFVTSLQGRDAAIQALRLGAFDFIEKPVSRIALEGPVKKAVRVSEAFQRMEFEMNQSLEQPHAATDKMRKAWMEMMKLRAMRSQKL